MLSLRLASFSLVPAVVSLLFASPARAQGFAEPPGRRHVIVDDDVRHGSFELIEPELRSSPVRFFVGPAGKFDRASALAGMFVALDLGRGPAGARLSGSWLDVGHERGLQQYAAEVTLDFGGHSRFHPVVGAGGGYGRTSSSLRADKSVDLKRGANLGIGLVRAGLGFRLPLDEADARVQLDVTGAVPAIRGDDTPLTAPWLTTSLSVGVGF